MASIHSIVYQPLDQAYGDRLGGYLRVMAPGANLVAGHGIEGDQKAGRNPQRQLNLLSQEWLEARRLEGYRTGPGQFGEQLILAGLAVERLQPGTRLQLGQDALIEITKARTGCDRLALVQGKGIEGLGPVGVLAKVIRGGKIAVGDPVTLIKEVAEDDRQFRNPPGGQKVEMGAESST